MARKRMFDSEVINQDSFFDLPMEAKALYFLLGMEADDEGFVSPKKVLRLYGGTADSIKILALKNFIIPFESGVIVITDWQNNNWLDKRRTKQTIYQDEKSQLLLNESTGKYELINPSNTNCLASAKQMLRENRIEENRIEENSIYIKSEAKAPDCYFIALPTNKFNTANECFYVTDEFLNSMKQIYPNVNVEQELRNMKGWLIANKTKRKTLNGMMKFINTWLSKQQNQSNNYQQSTRNRQAEIDQLGL